MFLKQNIKKKFSKICSVCKNQNCPRQKKRMKVYVSQKKKNLSVEKTKRMKVYVFQDIKETNLLC
jgi:hypothetical protein